MARYSSMSHTQIVYIIYAISVQKRLLHVCDVVPLMYDLVFIDSFRVYADAEQFKMVRRVVVALETGLLFSRCCCCCCCCGGGGGLRFVRFLPF